MKDKLFIANKIKVGFNLRADTYTGKLGYVIGHDGKKWRKEPSWERWREKYVSPDEFERQKRTAFNNSIEGYVTNGIYDYSISAMKPLTREEAIEKVGPYDKYQFRIYGSVPDETIEPVEFENVPVDGFVLNKKAGGYSTGWNHRSTYCRVYDPRGFEFEISIPNLLFILQECNAMRGKGLDGTFVYAWDGKDLVLLPTTCEEYTKSEYFTKMQKGKVSTKELLAGCTYKDKNLDEYIYLGKFNCFEDGHDYYNKIDVTNCKKSFVFSSVKEGASGYSFYFHSGMSNFVEKVTDTPISNYAEILDAYNKSRYSGTLSEVVPENIELPTTVEHFSYRTEYDLPSYMSEVGENKYELYDVEVEVEPYNYSYNSNNKTRKIKNYTLKTNKMVTLVNNDFVLKPIPPKVIEKVSLIEASKVKLKRLKIKRDNKTRTLTF